MPRTSSDDPVVHLCQLSAYHTADLMTRGAPQVFTCGIAEGHIYRVTIEPVTGPLAEDENYPTQKLANGKTVNVWDQVWIALHGEEGRGTWCGNRCGGRDTLAALYADAIKAEVLKQAAEKAKAA